MLQIPAAVTKHFRLLQPSSALGNSRQIRLLESGDFVGGLIYFKKCIMINSHIFEIGWRKIHFFTASIRSFNKGNVFSHVYLSVHRGGGTSCDHNPWCHAPPPPPPPHLFNLFTCDTIPRPSPNTSIGKRAVGLQLKGLVLKSFVSNPEWHHNYYRPQTKLREGNIFTPVCDSVHRVGVYPSMHHRSHGTPPGRHTHPPSPTMSGPYASYWNAFLFICGNIFKW